MPTLIGEDIGRYHVVEQLGEGGMASVFKAFDTHLERYVALKVILPSQQQSEQFLKRFDREAKSLAKLTHSHIVPVIDYGEHKDIPFLVMAFISGGTLREKIGSPMHWEEAARLIAPIASALAYAHRFGIIHRDVKPANILITESGQPMLSDFGIAKILETKTTALTGTGMGIGTPDYMCPEQGQGLPVDSRSDVYSLGVVFYEMITGRKPFQADTPLAVVVKHMTEPLPRPKKFIPDLPDGVEAVIFKALAKNPDDRYTDMSAFQAALEKLGRGIFSVESIAVREGSNGQKQPVSQNGDETKGVKPPSKSVAISQKSELVAEDPQQPNVQTQPVTPVLKSQVKTAGADEEEIPLAILMPQKEGKKSRGLPAWLYLLGGVGILSICGLLIYAGVYFFQQRGSTTSTPTETQGIAQITQTLPPQTQAPSNLTTNAVEISPTTSSTSGFLSADVNTLNVAFNLQPASLDPAISYENPDLDITSSIYETLVFPNPRNQMELIPMLASSWDVSADGLTYTFHIREGIRFQNGEEFTPEDVAYSLQRAIFIADAGPDFLLEALLGSGITDISQLVDPSGALNGSREGLVAADADTLRTACLSIKQAIVANDSNHTVIFSLATPWNPFLSLLATPYSGIMDKNWTIEQGGWNGSCETWQNYYSPVVFGDEPFYALANGTGPFILDHWDIQTGQIVLVRNDRYWLKEPLWEGGPSGLAAFSRIIISYINDASTRMTLMESGGADFADLSDASSAELQPLIGEQCSYEQSSRSLNCIQTGGQPLRKIGPVPTYSYSAFFFNFSVQPAQDGTNFLGSGKLDGTGIPPDFFKDIHIRRAFAYCIDYDSVIEHGAGGNGFRMISFPLPGSASYDPNAPHYEFNLEKCAQEFRSSEWPDLWNTGFYLRAAYRNSQILSEGTLDSLAANLAQVNSLFILEPVLVDLNDFRAYRNSGSLPVFTGNWIVDYFDTYQLFLAPISYNPDWQNLPEEYFVEANQILLSAAAETDALTRDDLYKQLNLWVYENVPAVPVMQLGQTSYQQRWMDGTMLSPLLTGEPYFYAYRKH
jgi:peptide/nickel transport system substrate-binding protein